MSGDKESGFSFGKSEVGTANAEPEDPVLRELYRKLRETSSPTATLDHLAINVLEADKTEYIALRNASKERVEWNIRDQD